MANSEPTPADKLVLALDAARRAKNYTEADRIRATLTTLGYSVETTPKGTRIHHTASPGYVWATPTCTRCGHGVESHPGAGRCTKPWAASPPFPPVERPRPPDRPGCPCPKLTSCYQNTE